MSLPLIPLDKANHLAYGAAIACAGSLLVSPATGYVLCVLAALGKELYDRASKTGTPDALDSVWTLIGGALVLLPVFGPVL